MRRTILLIALAAFLLPVAAMASGSSGAASIPTQGASDPAFNVTTNLKCTVIETLSGDRIRVRDDRSGTEHLIQLTSNIPLRAQSKKEFEGRKKLVPADFQEGQRILVTKRTDGESIVRIKVLKKKSKA